jgi:hypothetical protein
MALLGRNEPNERERCRRADSTLALTLCMHACDPATMQKRQRHAPVIFRPRPAASSISAKEPLQVRLPTSIKRRFKAHAAMRGMEANALFVEMWEHYERTRSNTNATKEI